MSFVSVSVCGCCRVASLDAAQYFALSFDQKPFERSRRRPRRRRCSSSPLFPLDLTTMFTSSALVTLLVAAQAASAYKGTYPVVAWSSERCVLDLAQAEFIRRDGRERRGVVGGGVGHNEVQGE